MPNASILATCRSEQDPYISARMASNSGNMLPSILKVGAPKWDAKGGMVANENTQGLEQILKPLGDKAADFFGYLAGKRADRLMKEGREKNFTQSEIEALLAKRQGNEELFDNANKEYQKLWKAAYWTLPRLPA